MIKEVPTRPTMRLSEENLRKHNAENSHDDRIRNEEIAVAEMEAYHRLVDDMDDLEDADLHVRQTHQHLRQAAEAGGLDTVQLDPSETPLDRFIKLHPLHDSHPWVARCAFREMGAGYDPHEAVDLRKLASEMRTVGMSSNGFHDRDTGSLRASSDTLSVSRFQDTIEARDEESKKERPKGKTRKQKRSNW
ncbi:hypothetical protein BU24DRAFT_454351 [Aaosphaeria arxii CBS 175.79]|uniref:Uncharacterized protein n=1 Tax=Aaosphaeria arxii CBS 175.79 TaxID=1450172 RepID=A0A6A5XCY5_9PLEO|nr:uncharacterized protein BU24DRAFT_454351 [Aaosphaeria arxii CBS 175.79]KAF2010779.1 hypothetical protein BU24DRAFT_454351 [Aaosphaeria arxii CBS 175.79]